MMIANKIIFSLPIAPLFTLLAHQSIKISIIQANISLSSSLLPSQNFLHCVSNGHNSFAPKKHRRPRSHGSHGEGTRCPGVPWFITTFPSLICSSMGRMIHFSTLYCDITRTENSHVSFPSLGCRRESFSFRQPKTATTTEPKRPSSPAIMLHLSKRSKNKSNYNNNNNNRRSKKIQPLASLLSLEMDLHSRNYAYVIGSDDSGGAGCIAGPVVVASCCVLHPVPLFHALLSESLLYDKDPSLPQQQQQQSVSLSNEEIQILKQTNDSKLLTPLQRRDIYNVLMTHPELFAITTSRRSPRQIDEMDVLTATKEAFAESIEELVLRWDLPRGEVYGVVDGRVAPKVFAYSSKENVHVKSECGTDDSVDATKMNDGGDDGNNNRIDRIKRDGTNNDQRFPVRPYINGDANVFTVALSSIIAKVTRDDLMKHEIHVKYPEYGFDVHLGYGTRDHVERVHRLGSLEGVHRMTFKQVKGR